METNKRRALGRGLEDLFNIEDLNYDKMEEKIMETVHAEEIKEIPLIELRANPYQPRKTFDENALNDLADSIREHGVIQPIIVKRSIKGYEIVAGERRFKASQIAGKETIPAIVRDFSDEQMMEIAILENLQRENLNAVDEAGAYQSLIKNLNLTQDQVAKRVGKSRSHITNMLGILNLPEEIKDLIIENKISMGHARVLSKIEDKGKIKELADEIITKGLSVRDLESLTTGDLYPRKNKIIKKEPNKEYKYVEEDLSEVFGTKVKINGKKIEIYFVNENDLNRLLEIIKK